MSSDYIDSVDQVPPEDLAEAMARLEARHEEIVALCRTRSKQLMVRRWTTVFVGLAAVLGLFAGLHVARLMMVPPTTIQIVAAPQAEPPTQGESTDPHAEALLVNGPIASGVPEPGTALLCAAGSLLFLRRRRTFCRDS